MGRAERRRAEKKAKKDKTATYNYTREQLEAVIRAGIQTEIEVIKKQTTEEAISKAMILFLVFPLYVLRDHYWKKTYKKRLPKFAELVWDYYANWQEEDLDIDKLKADLDELGGIKVEVNEDEK